MDDQGGGSKFNSHIFILEVQPREFFQWLIHVVEPIAAQLGLFSIQWGVTLNSQDTYGVIEIATLTEGGHWRDVLVTVDVVPTGGGQCIIELKGSGGSNSVELTDWIITSILAEWPHAQKGWNERRRQQEKEYRSPIPLSELAKTAPSQERLAWDYEELHKLDAVYKKNLKNEGGHPPLECNEWAYAELQRRPRDRRKIYGKWLPMYIKEVGPEVAALRDLRDVFNSAMRYRKQKDDKNNKSA